MGNVTNYEDKFKAENSSSVGSSKLLRLKPIVDIKKHRKLPGLDELKKEYVVKKSMIILSV